MWLIITYLVYYSTSTLQRYNKKFEPTKFINIFLRILSGDATIHRITVMPNPTLSRKGAKILILKILIYFSAGNDNQQCQCIIAMK